MKNNENMPIYMPNKMGNMNLAETYVLDQPYIEKYPLDEALRKGTLFPNLYRPYMKPHDPKKEC